MHLKTLTIKGFKSFAQPTTFQFEPGVTCVVGPNGSGKSNVVDALAWVMGEQGPKTLRGGKMEDVIFAGTATRSPLGRAEVVLTIDNADGALPIDYSEVTISRTLFRNGGSEYAINGEACRLLDVQELLSDSGLGREMHVIVGQGQLDQVLHATPEERRGFIEEAAGILKHRRRKEKTLRKLDAMQTNLTRLSDLAGELRRQLKPLGQQAEVAKQAADIQAEVRDARARLLADEIVTLRAQIADVARSEHERKTERIVLQEQLDQTAMRAKRLEAEELGSGLDEARRVAFALESVQERLRSLSSLAAQRIDLLAQAPEAVGVTVAPEAVDAARAEAQRLSAEVGTAEETVGAAATGTALARAALDALDEEIAAQSALVSRHDLELAGLAARLDVARSKLAAARGEQLRQEQAIAAADARRDEAAAALAAEEPGDVAAGDAPEDQAALEAAYRAAEDEVARQRAALDELRDRQHADERERDALAARASALTSALDGRDGSAAVVAAGIPGILGLVSDHVRVETGWEAAVAAALGSLADAVLAEDRSSAERAVAHARERDLGRIEVLVARPDGVAAPAGRDGIAAHVAEAPPGVLVVLAGLDATRDGDVTGRVVLRGGTGAKRSRIELLSERDDAQARLAEVATTIERTAGAIEDARLALETARVASQTALARLREHDALVAARSERLGALRKQAEAAEAERERLAAALAEATLAVEAAAAEAERTEREHAAFAAKPRPILDASQRDGLLADLEAKRSVELDARVALETVRERVRAERARADELEDQLRRERAAADEAARRAVLRRRRLEAAREVADRIPSVLDSVDRSVEAARAALVAREEERSRQLGELGALRAQEAQLRERLAAASENVHGLEMQVYEKKLHLSSLIERAAEELGLEEAVLVAEHGGQEDFDRDVERGRLAAAERRLAQLGRVNPLALEEFEALEQRHRFLQEQLKDLQETRADLLSIIEEVDGKMQDIFAAAFEDTRAAFAEVFPILFPGGTGSIQLTGDDLLTTGIEVSVRPAGKKIERLSLLSGGERSLAAVALLIAIFKARPSPFYVMDEVEAALDDANLGRLLTVMEDLREHSQLIVITHQKRTMEIADALYGVSMRQDGVSAVVGQRVGDRAAERASA
ncbi:MAG: chromosome segregation protein SMC [Micrococcales bacterium 73-13]|nr:MAG: chromosome segregation protein SMC [Micrococcales bacterium 73-13]